MKKAMLIAVDGLRSDAVEKCGNKFGGWLKDNTYYTLDARSIMPSVTLPAFVSMFHSVPAERHGVVTNTFTPMARPLPGLCEQIKSGNKTSAFFYNWENLRDLALAGSLSYSYFANLDDFPDSEDMLVGNALSYIEEKKPDFAFVYLGKTDIAGHCFGWMGQEYLKCTSEALSHAERLVKKFGDEYTFILTADHGGHLRCHGTDCAEDMTVPFFIYGRDVKKGIIEGDVSIMDVPPTVARILDVKRAAEWEGKSIL